MPSDEAMQTAQSLRALESWGTEARMIGRYAQEIDCMAHLPALLAVAKAAKEYLDAVDEGNNSYVVVGHENRLRAALALLEKGVPDA